MIITISGTMGSGKSTLAKRLSEVLHFKRFYMGQIFRNLAKQRGLTIREYAALGETDPNIDKEVDDYQRELSRTNDNSIFEGRTSFHVIPNTTKLYLYNDIKIGAERVFGDLKHNPERNEGDFANIAEVEKEIKKRLEIDKGRYEKYYKIDVFNPANYDLSIDTSRLTREETFDIAYNYIKKHLREEKVNS